jgi:hypothetical protein
MTTENIYDFYKRHCPASFEQVLWYTRENKALPVKLQNAVLQYKSFVLCSESAGSGKHLILSILSKTLNINFTYIDESISLDTFENMCKRQNVLDFLKTDDVTNLTTPYFVFEECHVNNKHSVLLNASCAYTWPCILLITTSENTIMKCKHVKQLCNQGASLLVLRKLPISILSKYVCRIASQYKFPVSERASILIAKQSQGNVRYMLSLLHRLLSLCTPTKNEQLLTSDSVQKAFTTSFMDTFRNLSDVHKICKETRTFTHKYRSEIAMSHPISVQAEIFQNYSNMNKNNNNNNIHSISNTADLFSLTDTFDNEHKHVYFVNMFLCCNV